MTCYTVPMVEQYEHSTVLRQYPRAYFAAPVYFATTLAALAGSAIADTIATYTGLYRELTGKPPATDAVDPTWATLISRIERLTDPEAITTLVYAAYCRQPRSIYDPARNDEQARIAGVFGYVYDAADRQARLHFFPRRGAVSALASTQAPQRRAEFRQLLIDIKQTHPEAETLKSSTWLQNIPNYRTLFPKAFTNALRDIGGGSYLGVWGQFVRGDGSGNLDRLATFIAALANAQTVAEAIDALPLNVLEGVGPITDFYAEYRV
jgi:hypothetical protein